METKHDKTTQGQGIEKEDTENIYEFVDRLFMTQGERNSKGGIRIETVGDPRS